VNRKVHDVVETIWSRGGGIAGLVDKGQVVTVFDFTLMVLGIYVYYVQPPPPPLCLFVTLYDRPLSSFNLVVHLYLLPPF
jgi:hypothetical protein